MKKIKKDYELIAKRKCQAKSCNEKSEAILNKKFYCGGCCNKLKNKEFRRIHFDKARLTQLTK